MSPFLRKVKTASGATDVQIVEKKHGIRSIVEHLGSAHNEAELAVLLQVGREELALNQQTLDLPMAGGFRPRLGEGKQSRLLVDVLGAAWRGSGSP